MAPIPGFYIGATWWMIGQGCSVVLRSMDPVLGCVTYEEDGRIVECSSAHFLRHFKYNVPSFWTRLDEDPLG